MASFWTHISKCSERGQNYFFCTFHRGICNKKSFERLRIFRYGLPKDILSKGQKTRKGGGAPCMDERVKA